MLLVLFIYTSLTINNFGNQTIDVSKEYEIWKFDVGCSVLIIQHTNHYDDNTNQPFI